MHIFRSSTLRINLSVLHSRESFSLKIGHHTVAALLVMVEDNPIAGLTKTYNLGVWIAFLVFPLTAVRKTRLALAIGDCKNLSFA